jgi:hypothetical protein
VSDGRSEPDPGSNRGGPVEYISTFKETSKELPCAIA